MGYRVLVSDMYSERPGYALADEHECVDITDIAGTLQVAERHHIDGILCDTTDAGVPTMGYIADRLGLPGIGYETALNFTNKYRMRQLTSAAGVPNPTFLLAHNVEEVRAAVWHIGVPAVVKPVDAQSSRGVHIIRQSAAIESSALDALGNSRTGFAIVESFLGGIESTVESVCLDGAVYVAGISDKDHFAFRPEVASRLTYPAIFPTATLERIRIVNELAIRALGLTTGITHAEYMVLGDEVYLVEIAARGAGSRVYSHIVPFLTGAPVPRLYLQFVMGEQSIFEPEPAPRAANLAFFSFPPGIVSGYDGLEEARRIRGVQEILLEFRLGDALSTPTDDRSRHGFALVFGSSRGEVIQTTDEVFQTIRVCIE